MRWNYYKFRQLTLLQSAMDSCYKLRQLFYTKCDTVYYKLRQVLQSAMDLLQIATGITKSDDYYKLRQYSRNLTGLTEFVTTLTIVCNIRQKQWNICPGSKSTDAAIYSLWYLELLSSYPVVSSTGPLPDNKAWCIILQEI